MIFVAAFLGAVALVVVVLFSVQNAAPVTVWFYNWRFDASLAIVVYLSVVAGIVIETLFLVSLRLRRTVKRRAQRPDKAAEKMTSQGENLPGAP